MSWGSESRRGELKGFSRNPHSITERKYAQEFLFNPPMSGDQHDDRMSKVYSPEEGVFGDALADDLTYQPKKHERKSWRKFDSEGSNDIYGGDWTKELGINRKVLLVDPADKKSNFNVNKVCSEQALLQEFDQVERVLSRTVSFKNHEKFHTSSSKSENFRNHAHISQPSSDLDISENGTLPPAPPAPDISLNLEAVELQIEKLDREFEKIILNGSKSGVDLDLIEKKSEERRILKNTLKQIKKKLKCGYRNIKWESVHQRDVFLSIKEQEFIKPSFIIAGKFRDLDQAKEYFGKFGTLSKAEWINNKIKLEYFERNFALKALEARHSKSIDFFLDPNPEATPKKHKGTAKSEDTDDYTKKVIDSYFSQKSRKSPTNLRVDHFDDNSCIQSQHVVDWPKKEEKYPKVKNEFKKYSPADFKPNKQNMFSITITNHRHLFNSEEELYEYFVAFGNINSVAYTDGSEIQESLDSRKEVSVDFEAGHSLLLAVNHEHPDINVSISDECKVEKKVKECESRYTDPYSRKRKKSRDLSAHHGNVIGVGNTSPKHKKFDHFSDKENEKDYMFDENNSKYSHQKRMTKSFENKHAYVPNRHNKNAKWECQECGTVNSPADYFHCYNCKHGRPGNWICSRCEETNTPEKLYCFKRNCQEMRKGNWVCPDEKCQNVNWSRSLHCYEDGCYEVQPGAWNCKECTKLNFKDNNNCYFCKKNIGMNARKRDSFHDTRNFAKNAELEKQRQAFEKIHQDENRNDLEKPSDAHNDRLHQDKSSFDNPRVDAASKPAKDWASDFAMIKKTKEKAIKEGRKKAQVVQNKLLAIAGEYQSAVVGEPQPGPSGFGRAQKSNSVGFGRSRNSNPWHNAMTEEVVDIADSDEEPSIIEETFVHEEPIVYQNANLVPISPRKNRTRKPSVADNFDDVLMQRLKHGRPNEQAEILKKFNIVQIESPPNLNSSNVVEVDLASDSEDETGRYSDGSSIHIDAMEVDQDIVTESDHVGTVPRRDNSYGNLNHLKNRTSGKDQNLINQIVDKDLENINLNRNHTEQEGSALTLDFHLEEDDDIVILSDEESVK